MVDEFASTKHSVYVYSSASIIKFLIKAMSNLLALIVLLFSYVITLLVECHDSFN